MVLTIWGVLVAVFLEWCAANGNACLIRWECLAILIISKLLVPNTILITHSFMCVLSLYPENFDDTSQNPGGWSWGVSVCVVVVCV
jgi:hypothetical protein